MQAIFHHVKFHVKLFSETMKLWSGKFQKFEYLKKQKSILGEIKSIFHNFSRTFFGEM